MNNLPSTSPAPGRPSVLSLNINSRSALFASYMPFLKRGGLFVPTTRTYALGDEIFVSLSLMDDPVRLPIAGLVVWVTPAGAQSNQTQGVGVHFGDDESGLVARKKIETLLGAYLGSTRPTHSM